jgi:hypothetical protein
MPDAWDRLWRVRGWWDSSSSATTPIVVSNNSEAFTTTTTITTSATTAATLTAINNWLLAHEYYLRPTAWEQQQLPQWQWRYPILEQTPHWAGDIGPQEREPDDYTRERQALRREHERANARAEALLTGQLTPAQQEELRARGHFHIDIVSSNGERRRYRIRRGRHGNIDQVDDHGRVLRSLCVHPTMNVPDADTMLAQKLWLEGNESELLRTANHFNIRGQDARRPIPGQVAVAQM